MKLHKFDPQMHQMWTNKYIPLNMTKNTQTVTKDVVNHPEHYTIGGIEAIDYMRAKSTKEEFIGYLRLNALKYLSRANYKNDALEDYKKGSWYLTRLIQELEINEK